MRILVDGRMLLSPGQRVRLVLAGPISSEGFVTGVNIRDRGRTLYDVAFVDEDGKRSELGSIDEFELEPIESEIHGERG